MIPFVEEHVRSGCKPVFAILWNWSRFFRSLTLNIRKQ